MIKPVDGAYDLICDLCNKKSIRCCPSPFMAEECACDDGWKVIPFKPKHNFHICPDCVRKSWEEYPMNDCRDCGNLETEYLKGYRDALKDVLTRLDDNIKIEYPEIEGSVTDFVRRCIVQPLRK